MASSSFPVGCPRVITGERLGDWSHVRCQSASEPYLRSASPKQRGRGCSLPNRVVGMCCSRWGVGLGLGPHWCETLGKVRMWFLGAWSWAQYVTGVLTSQGPPSQRPPPREVGKGVSSEFGVVISKVVSI